MQNVQDLVKSHGLVNGGGVLAVFSTDIDMIDGVYLYFCNDP